MDIAGFKKRLREKEHDLQSDLARHVAEGRDDAQSEVHEHMDQVISLEDSEGQFQQSDSDWQLIKQVREALGRIEEGTYGKCIDCGRQIELSRLDAIPWTPYCLDDQTRHDRLSHGGDTSEPTL